MKPWLTITTVTEQDRRNVVRMAGICYWIGASIGAIFGLLIGLAW